MNIGYYLEKDYVSKVTETELPYSLLKNSI